MTDDALARHGALGRPCGPARGSTGAFLCRLSFGVAATRLYPLYLEPKTTIRQCLGAAGAVLTDRRAAQRLRNGLPLLMRAAWASRQLV